MRYLITGGAGFIGSNFARRLLDRGEDVTNLDALARGGVAATVDELNAYPNHAFVHGDIRDSVLLDDIMLGHDVVVHFAAESHVDRSIVDPSQFVSANVVGTTALIDSARRIGVPRFVHVSTDEVYGSIETGRATEDQPLRPSSPYAASKAAADLVVLSYAKTYGYDAVVTRGSNTYGPYQYPEKVVPHFVTRLIRGEPVPLYGTGENERDWMHVADHCSAIDTVLARGEPGGVYNIGTGLTTTNRDLTNRLLALTGMDASHVMPVDDRPGHDFRYSVDASKVRQLGWVPETNLDSGLGATVEWYRSRRGWWDGLVGGGTPPLVADP